MIPDIASQQEGCFSRDQARAAGYSDRQITYRLATGQWRSLTPAVMTAAVTPVSRSTWMHAALLAAGPLSLLSHLTAATLLGLYAGAVNEVHVTVPWRRRTRLPAPCVVHRVGAQPEAFVVRAGLRCTPVPRTVVDCLGVLSPMAAMRLVDEVLLRRAASPPELVQALAERRRRHGIVRARATVNAIDGAASEAERRVHRIFRRAGLRGWRPNYEILSNGRIIGVADVAFPALRLAIEIDGMAWHTDQDRFQRDRTRQNALVAAGWTVLRFTWWDVTVEPDRVLDEVRSALTRLAA